MRIKRLDIAGFKSFADKARLTFGEGITGVVGPNGCGKSNIVDAIRWCMGEMSAKHLRGKAMQDVIFAGAEGRSAQGLAEVTLTFDNDGDVPQALVNFSEIAVTRRLYRDGQSEYLINKTQVRLRDVTDLFLGTGVGTRAYSIIEQGRIGFVINSKPEERRSLIEEVAGITKFKARKKAAERRMEQTQANLSRVGDIVKELDRQLVTLVTEAERALKFRALRDRQRDMELHAASMTYLSLDLNIQMAQQRMFTLGGDSQDGEAALAEQEAVLEAKRLALVEDEQKLSHTQQHSHALNAALAVLVGDLGHWREQRDAATLSAQHASDEMSATQAQIKDAELDLKAQKEHAELGQKDGADDAMHKARAQADVDAVSAQVSALHAEIEEVRRVMGIAGQTAAAERVRAQSRDHDVVQEEARHRHAHTQLKALASEQASAEALRQTLLDAHLVSAQKIKAMRLMLLEHQRLLPALQQAHKEAQQRHDDANTAWVAGQSRLKSLSELARRLTGFDDGVRTLMGEKVSRREGLLALVAEWVEPPKEHERAIEAALGQCLQYIVADAPDTAVAAIEHLKAVNGGRSGFFVEALAAQDGAKQAGVDLALPTGALGRASHLVVGQASPAMLDILLGHVILMPDVASALAAARVHAHEQAKPLTSRPIIFAAPDGTLIDSAGTIVGGAQEGAGLLANRREIRDLTQAQAALQSDAQSQAEAVKQAAKALEKHAQSLQAHNEALHAQEIQTLALEKDAEAQLRHIEAFKARHEAVLGDVKRAQDTVIQLKAEAQAAVDNAERAQSEHDAVKSSLIAKLAQAQALGDEQDKLQGIKNQMMVRDAERKERALAAEQSIMRLTRMMDGYQARMARLLGECEAASLRGQELDAKILEASDTEHARLGAAQAAQEELKTLRKAYEEEQSALLACEHTWRERRRKISDAQHEVTEAKLACQRLILQKEALTNIILERYDCPLANVLPAYHDRAAPNAAFFKEQKRLDNEIKAMGAINLTAIEQCRALKVRHGFLSGQKRDLEDALEALRQAIGRINQTSRERFEAAFAAVDQTFQKVYPRLFEGGSARLELVQSDDILEAGVDIVAMPPGKKLQNVSLLSGGEKALTATALVFAIFLIKPSPFCILDEVDAPLDEANVGRFNDMLREISKVSQFIVITHNKQTMVQADRLYGITMEDKGMSKVVAVDLSRREKAA